MPDERDRSRPDPEILERNLSRLFREAYLPVEPSAGFRRRLQEELRRRQARGLGARVLRTGTLVASGLSAAAVLVVGIVLAVLTRGGGAGFHGDVAPGAGSGAYLMAQRAAGGSWQESRRRVRVLPGDRLATPGDGDLRVSFSRGVQVELDSGSVLLLSERSPRLLQGSARVSTPRRHTDPFETPYHQIASRGALYRVEVDSRPPAAPVTKENLEMNKKLGTSLVVGAVLVVTVIVYQTWDEPVTVETQENGAVAVSAGETGTFTSDGEVRVVPTSAPDPEEGAGSIPALATVERQERIELRGRVIDVAGEPLPGAAVRFELASGEETAVPPVTADEEGAFLLRVPKGESGAISATLDRYEETRVEWSQEEEPAPSEELPRPDGPAENEVEEVLITLRTETAIAGVVTLSDAGERPENVLVGIQYFVDPWRWYDPDVRTFGEDGSFYFGGIQPGSYRVWAYAEGYFRSQTLVVSPTNGERAEVTISLQPGCSLEGMAFDQETGQPVSGAVVYAPVEYLPGTLDPFNRQLAGPKVRNVAETDSAGAFLLQDLPPGRHRVRILHPDYRPLDEFIVVSPESVKSVEIALRPGPGIRGRVLDEHGEPLPNAAVIAFTMTMDPLTSESTLDLVDEEGQYHIRNLNPGRYIVVRLKDLESEDADNAKVTMATVPPDRDAEVDFVEVARLATLRGVIRDPRDEPLPNISVTLSLMSDDGADFTFESGVTDTEGRYEIRNLELKSYTVGLARNFSQNFVTSGTVEFTEPIDYERDFVFENLSVRGRVATAGDEGVSNVELILLTASENGAIGDFAGRSISGHDGEFEVEGLPSGGYVIVATASGFRRTMSERFELKASPAEPPEVKIQIQPGGSVEVEVIDSAGKPRAGVVIRLRDEAGRVMNEGLPPVTDERGIYVFESLWPGPHTATAVHDGVESEPVPFTASSEKRARVRIDLPAP